MKSSQSIPGPQSATSPMTGGAMAGSPQVSQGTAADPSQVSQDVTPAPKPIYGGVDVSPEIAPPNPMNAPAPASNPAQTALGYFADHMTPKNENGRMLADVLRNLGSSYTRRSTGSPKPSWQSMGGWQSLMQRMQPR